MIVGLTGGIASGKSTVAELFRQQQVPTASADDFSRALTEHNQPAWRAIVDRFGDDILLDDGQIDRAALRRLVFGNADKKRDLEAILHPLIWQAFEDWSQQQTSTLQIWEIPLLLETDSQNRVDRILLVDCSPELQKRRLKERDGRTDEEISAVIAQQLSRGERLAAADDIIVNDADIEHLRSQVEQLLSLYRQLEAVGASA